MSDNFGLDKAARREALNNLKEAELRIPVGLNLALPGQRTPFDWRYFDVNLELPQKETKETL